MYVASLLHDIGKLVLVQTLPDHYRKIVNKVQDAGQTSLEVEQRALNFTHCYITSILLEPWSFPHSQVSDIHRHYSPPKAGEGASPTVACLACPNNHFAKKMGVGFSDRQYRPQRAISVNCMVFRSPRLQKTDRAAVFQLSDAIEGSFRRSYKIDPY